MTADKLNAAQTELLKAAFELGVAVLGQDGEIITDPAFVAELRINRALEGRDLITGKLPVEIPAEVWCTNDESAAVGVVDGTSYCATCITYAAAGQPR